MLDDSVLQLNMEISSHAHAPSTATTKTGKAYESQYTTASIHLGTDHLARDLLWLPGCTIAHWSMAGLIILSVESHIAFSY